MKKLLLLPLAFVFACNGVDNYNKETKNNEAQETAIEEWDLMFKMVSDKKCLTSDRLNYWEKRAKNSFKSASDLKFVTKEMTHENSECIAYGATE